MGSKSTYVLSIMHYALEGVMNFLYLLCSRGFDVIVLEFGGKMVESEMYEEREEERKKKKKRGEGGGGI